MCNRLLAYLQVLSPESVVIKTRLVEVTSLTVQFLSSVVSALPLVIVVMEMLIFTLSPGLRFLGLLTLSSEFGSVDMTTAVVVLVLWSLSCKRLTTVSSCSRIRLPCKRRSFNCWINSSTPLLVGINTSNVFFSVYVWCKCFRCNSIKHWSKFYTKKNEQCSFFAYYFCSLSSHLCEA